MIAIYTVASKLTGTPLILIVSNNNATTLCNVLPLTAIIIALDCVEDRAKTIQCANHMNIATFPRTNVITIQDQAVLLGTKHRVLTVLGIGILTGPGLSR